MSKFYCLVCWLAGWGLSAVVAGEEIPKLGKPLSQSQATAFARLALKNIDREYPNKPGHVMTGPKSVQSPRELHPAFYGSFDWHSCVHGHWMLVRLLRLHPGLPAEREIREKLTRHLSAENLAKEAAYFDEKEHRSFERMYGWAWLLRLAAELHEWDDADGKQWLANLRPLETRIVALTKDYLPRLSYPIRTGVHPDTGFALGQAIDYARTVGDRALEELVIERSRAFYGDDCDYPVGYEPSGEDFFSSGLNEADLMRRILPPAEFARWLDLFLPQLSPKVEGPLWRPVAVTDVTDGKLVHLAGLDLSRAWTMRGIARCLPDDDPRRASLETLASQHAEQGLQYVFSGHYEGEHWLATFAVYLQTGVGLAAE